MVREVLTINVGQGGIQLSNAVWGQYCAEHAIKNDGKPGEKFNRKDLNFTCFFEETQVGQYVPRNLNVDLETSVNDDIANGATSALFHPEFLISGKEDAANNFARGHYTVGKEQEDKVNDRIRKLVDNSENVQGFVVHHSVGGGTGSGLGMLILERIAVDYRKKQKIGFEIYPSPTISTCIVEPYNGLLSTHWLLDHTDVSLVLDNEACYEICQTKLDLKKPSYSNLNRIIAKVVSSMTASLRFDGELNVDLNDFVTNLVPFPRLHFMTTSLAPVIAAKKGDKESYDCKSMTTNVLNKDSFLVKYSDFDVVEDKYMAISLNYRGDVKSKEANQTVLFIKNSGKVSFVEWVPTGFKIGMNNVTAAILPDDDLADSPRQATMIGNNIAVSRVFTQRLSKKYDMMYSQRAYVHWYVGEGMEEGEFSEAREDLGFLEKDYLDVIAEQNSEAESSEE